MIWMRRSTAASDCGLLVVVGEVFAACAPTTEEDVGTDDAEYALDGAVGCCHEPGGAELFSTGDMVCSEDGGSRFARAPICSAASFDGRDEEGTGGAATLCVLTFAWLLVPTKLIAGGAVTGGAADSSVAMV